MPCPCGSNEKYESCCGPYHNGAAVAPNAEKLMRSRYSAFAMKNMNYIIKTTDPVDLVKFDRTANERWMLESEFLKLEILQSSENENQGTVEFQATFKHMGKVQTHHEVSAFRKINGNWFYRISQ